MPIEAKDVAGALRHLLNEHAELNWEEISRGELVEGDIVSLDGYDAADIDLIQLVSEDVLRIDMSDGTAFRIIIERIPDAEIDGVAKDIESSKALNTDSETDTDDLDGQQEPPPADGDGEDQTEVA